MRFSGEQSGSAFRASLAFRIMFLFETILRAGILTPHLARLVRGVTAPPIALLGAQSRVSRDGRVNQRPPQTQGIGIWAQGRLSTLRVT